MNLHTATKGEYKTIKTLYSSAFPRNERAPFFFIKHRAMQNRATMLVAEDNGEFVGFAYTISYNNMVYLFYFAIAENKRGCGNGSEILRLLKAYYENKIIFLGREQIDDTANNNAERIKRRDFYIRNGFFDLPSKIEEVNVVYDLMSTSKDVTASDYNALVEHWAGAFALRFVKMRFIE